MKLARRRTMTQRAYRICFIFCWVFTNNNLNYINIILVQNNIFENLCIDIILHSNHDFSECFRLLLLQIIFCPNLNLFNCFSNTYYIYSLSL